MGQNIDFEILVRDKGGIAKFEKLDKTLGKVDSSQKKVGKSAQKLWKQFAAGMGVATAVTTAARKIVTAFSDGVKAAVDFEASMANVSTLVDTGTVSMAAFEQGILSMAGELGSATDLTNGLYQALSAGVEPAKALGFVEQSAKFAKAALTDTHGAVDLLSTVLNAYGMSASEAGRVSDVLFQTIKDGKTTGELLTSALGQVIPTAESLGVELEHVTAAIATMTKSGIDTNTAVTALNATMIALIKPSEDAKKAAEELGLNFSKAGVEGAGGFQQFLVKLKAAVGDNETMMARLFPNVRALKAAFSLTGAGADEFAKILDNMYNSSENVNIAFEKQQKTAAATAEAIKNRLSAAFTQALLPALRSFSSWVSENKESIVNTFQNILSVIGSIIEIGSKVVGIIIDIGNAILNMPSLAPIIDGWEAILAAVTNVYSKLEEQQIAAIQEQNDQFNLLNKTLQELADKAGLSKDVMRQLTKEFIDIQDPTDKTRAKINAIKFRLFAQEAALTEEQLSNIIMDFKNIQEPAERYKQIMIAIVQGKYDTETRKLSDEFKKLNSEYQISSTTIKEVSDKTKKLSTENQELGKTTSSVTKEVSELKEILIPTTSVFDDLLPNIKTFSEEFQNLHFSNVMPGITKHLDETTQVAKELGIEIMPGVNLNFQQLTSIFKETKKKAEENKYEFIDLSQVFISLSTTTESAFKAIEQLELNLGALPAIIQAVMGGLNSIGAGINAIQKAGKGLTGILSGLSGGFSVLTGFISTVSSVLGALSGPSGELEAARRRMQGLQMNTEGWGAKIEELAKQLGGADSAGRAFNILLADMIRDSDITVNNFDNYITKVREIVSTYEQGNATIEETQRNFGAAFDAIIQTAQGLGIEGAQSLRGLIELADEFGLSVKEINDYIDQNMDSALAGWGEAVKSFGQFSIPIFDDMLKLQEKIADNQQLIDSIHGADQAMMDLAKTPNFGGEQFNVFQQIAVDAMKQLEAAGFSTAQAMESDAGLRGMLQNIIFLSEQYGFKIDDATQALIDQGIASGALTTQTKSDSDIMREGFDRMVIGIERLVELMGGELPNAVDYMAGRTTASLDAINRSTLQWSNSVGQVYDDISDVINNVDRLGNTHDNVMWGHSIIPDMIRWALENDKITDQIKNNLITTISGMGEEYTDIIDKIKGKPLFAEKLFDEYKNNFQSLFRDVLTQSQAGTQSFFSILDEAISLGFGKDVEKFKNEAMESAFSSYEKIKDIQSIDREGIIQEILKKQSEIKKAKQGTYKSAKLTSELDDLQTKLDDVTSAQAVFGSTSIKVFEDMHAWQQKIADNRELIQGIESATSLLADFSKVQKLNEDQYQEFEDIVNKAWSELESQGFSTGEIYKQLGPMLEKLNILNNQFGYDIDENTQKLIDQGLKGGLISEDMKTDAEKQIELAEKQYELWIKIAQILGADVTENLEGLNDAINDLNLGEGYTGKTELDAFEQKWKQQWEDIAANEEMTENFIDELSNLDIGENLKVRLQSLIDWVTLTGEKIQEGFVWDPTTRTFIQPPGFQHGTSTRGFIVPSGYPNDTFPARFSSGEKITIEPKGGFRGNQTINHGGDTYIFNVDITGSPGGDSEETLMEKFYQGWKYNKMSIKPRMKQELKSMGVQFNG